MLLYQNCNTFIVKYNTSLQSQLKKIVSSWACYNRRMILVVDFSRYPLFHFWQLGISICPALYRWPEVSVTDVTMHTTPGVPYQLIATAFSGFHAYNSRRTVSINCHRIFRFPCTQLSAYRINLLPPHLQVSMHTTLGVPYQLLPPHLQVSMHTTLYLPYQLIACLQSYHSMRHKETPQAAAMRNLRGVPKKIHRQALGKLIGHGGEVRTSPRLLGRFVILTAS